MTCYEGLFGVPILPQQCPDQLIQVLYMYKCSHELERAHTVHQQKTLQRINASGPLTFLIAAHAVWSDLNHKQCQSEIYILVL